MGNERDVTPPIRVPKPLPGDLTVTGMAVGLPPADERLWDIELELPSYGQWYVQFMVAEPEGCTADSTGAETLAETVDLLLERLRLSMDFDPGCQKYRLEWCLSPADVWDPQPFTDDALDGVVLPRELTWAADRGQRG